MQSEGKEVLQKFGKAADQEIEQAISDNLKNMFYSREGMDKN